MRSFILFAIAAMAVTACSVAARDSSLTDPSDPGFQARNAWFIGTLASGRSQGEIWEQVTQTIAPVDFSTGQLDPFNGLMTSIQQYTWYQDNYYNATKGAFCSVQAWPRVYEGAPAWAMQHVCVYIEDLFTRKETSSTWPPSQVTREGPPTYSIVWESVPIAESLFVQGSDRLEVAMSQNAGCISWRDSVSGKELLNECLTNTEAGKFRLYSLNVILEAVSGVPSTSFLVWNTFRSTAKVPPQVIVDAFTAWYAGQVPVLPDPASEYGTSCHLYVPPSAKRMKIDSNFNGATLVTDAASLEKALANAHF